MAAMGYGYGSECHLLRWMGRHRRAFDTAVCKVLQKTDGPVDWLDMEFNPSNPWPDRELKGLEFIGKTAALDKWKEEWPASGNSQNWDAVGWWGNRPVLVEAKAHTGEIHSECGAKPNGGRPRIEQTLRDTALSLGMCDLSSSWMKPHYQFANRLAVLRFLHSHGYPARLVMIYFVGDRHFPSCQPPQRVEDWTLPLATQKLEMGLPARHDLSPFIHELFLHVCEPVAWSRPAAAAKIDLTAGRAT